MSAPENLPPLKPDDNESELLSFLERLISFVLGIRIPKVGPVRDLMIVAAAVLSVRCAFHVQLPGVVGAIFSAFSSSSTATEPAEHRDQLEVPRVVVVSTNRAAALDWQPPGMH